MKINTSHSLRILVLAVVTLVIALLAIYLPLIQTIPNGSSHYFMIDVGETQIVLNQWGSLHATSYPLYVITGNLITNVLSAIGIGSVTAPAVVSLLWGIITALLMWSLATHLTGRVWLSVVITLLYGLTRTMWIHNVIAEIYSFGLLIHLLLLWLALYRGHIAHRIYWLALIGGIGIAHHRAVAMNIPALLYAVWPQFQHTPRKHLPRLLLVSLLLGLAGMLQYIYPYLRARAGAAWVYGEPGTLSGLWDEIIGKEASRFIGLPASMDGLLANITTINQVLITDLTGPGIVGGILGLIVATRQPSTHRAGITFTLVAVVAYLFHITLYHDVLSALVLPITSSLAFGWLFLADTLLRRYAISKLAISVSIVLLALTFIYSNIPFIHTQVTDPTGQQTITALEEAPADSTVMLAWGPRYFAASVGQILQGKLQHITLADNKSDLITPFINGQLITPEYTLYNQPLTWWEEQLGQPVYLQAAAPYMVRLNPQPEIVSQPTDSENTNISAIDAQILCQGDEILLMVTWQAITPPDQNLSVFVKALDTDGNLQAQADQSAPVYGWRPTTTWLAGERIRDIYPISVIPGQVTTLSYGLYHMLDNGTFENVVEYMLPVNCSAP